MLRNKRTMHAENSCKEILNLIHQDVNPLVKTAKSGDELKFPAVRLVNEESNAWAVSSGRPEAHSKSSGRVTEGNVLTVAFSFDMVISLGTHYEHELQGWKTSAGMQPAWTKTIEE